MQYNTADENDPCSLYVWIQVSRHILFMFKVGNKTKKNPKEIVPHGQKNYRKRIKFRKKVKWAQAEINVSDTSNDSVN